MTLLTPFKLTSLGLFHTLVSLVCVVAAFVALYQDHGISPHTRVGQLYLVSLWITIFTGFPIFRNGKTGPPHILGVLSVVVLLIAALAVPVGVFGRAAGTIETVAYSLSVLLLMIPTVTETLTRVPPGRPWVASPDAPVFRVIYSVLIVLFLVGVTLQVRG